jgi:hypothetical protein
MALVTTSVGFNDLFGTVGSDVFQKQRNIQTLRATKYHNVSKKSWAQTERNYVIKLTKNWSNMGDNDRIPWLQQASLFYAGKLPYNRKHISGFNLYCQCMLNLLSVGVDTLTLYPTLELANIPNMQGMTFNRVSDDIYFSYTSPIYLYYKYQIKCSCYLTNGLQWNKSFVNVYDGNCSVSPTINIASYVRAKLGAFPVYDFNINFRVRIIDIRCGLAGLWLPYTMIT